MINRHFLNAFIMITLMVYPSQENLSAETASSSSDGASSSTGNGFCLRDNVSNISVKPNDAKGATLSFSQDRIKNNGNTWNSTGVLGYRVDINPYTSWLIPAVSWNVSRTAGSPDKNVEELEFSLPVTLKQPLYTNDPALLSLTARPYYLTDFSFADEIYGVEASAEFIGRLFGPQGLYLGGYYNPNQNEPIQYQLRAVPKIDYSVTQKGGDHTVRQPGDDWFRAGGMTSLDILFNNIFEVSVSYEYRGVVSGNGLNVHLFTSSGKYWLDPNKNVAIKLGYSKGQSLETAQNVDLLTLSFEWKK